jgi:hypothetical protein
MNQKENNIVRVAGSVIVAASILMALASLGLLPAWYGIVLLACGILGTCSGAVILIAQSRRTRTTDKPSRDSKNGAA